MKTRIMKAPEERKQEILDTAMKLFAEKGYEATSMADIAQAMDVAKGLCYRYFDSKQKLFEEAMEQYVVLCCSEFLPVIHDRTKSWQERIALIGQLMEDLEKTAKYRAFFHQDGNRSYHEQLSLKMCHVLYPHIMEEVQVLQQESQIEIKHADILIRFILYGQIGLVSNHDYDTHEIIELLQQYMQKLLHA